MSLASDISDAAGGGVGVVSTTEFSIPLTSTSALTSGAGIDFSKSLLEVTHTTGVPNLYGAWGRFVDSGTEIEFRTGSTSTGNVGVARVTEFSALVSSAIYTGTITGTTLDVAIAAVDPAKAIISDLGCYTTLNPSLWTMFYTLKLINSTTVRITSSGASGGLNVAFQVVEI